MAAYDLAFASKLAEVASEVESSEPYAYDARRVVAYLSRLSVEITLKALLEAAGRPVSEIRRRSHDLRGLLDDLSACEVEVEVAPGVKAWSSAARIRAAVVDLGLVHVPIGELICAEDQGASRYPNQIRYGETVIDMNPSLLASMAVVAANWARANIRTIRIRGGDV